MNQLPSAFWSISATEILQHLGTAKEGLSSEEARQRLARYGSNLLKPQKRSDVLTLLLAQFKSPLILILLFATGLSFFLHDPVNALIILTIVLVSGLLGFWQEHSATNAVEKLLAVVQIKAAVLRDGSPAEIPIEEIVPGDCLVQESKDLFIDEATLTGELRRLNDGALLKHVVACASSPKLSPFFEQRWGYVRILTRWHDYTAHAEKVGRSEGDRWRTGRTDISRTPSFR